MTDRQNSDNPMEQGTQPLDAVMVEMNLSNHDLVVANKGQLTHKTVNKARKGRQLTKRSQRKVIDAVNAVRGGRSPYQLEDLFSYRGR
jgi:hypothetical protein